MFPLSPLPHHELDQRQVRCADVANCHITLPWLSTVTLSVVDFFEFAVLAAQRIIMSVNAEFEG